MSIRAMWWGLVLSAFLWMGVALTAAHAQVSNPGVQQQGSVTANHFVTWAGDRLIKEGGTPQDIFNAVCGGIVGALYYHDALYNTTCLPQGTAGQVLTSGGTGVAPSWTSVGGTGTVTSVGLSSSTLTIGGTNPVTGSGTITVEIPSTVTAGSIGGASAIPILNYNAQGRVTGVSSASPVISSLTDLPPLAINYLIVGTGSGNTQMGWSTFLGLGSGCTTTNAVYYRANGSTTMCTAPSTANQVLYYNGSVTQFGEPPYALTSYNGAVRILDAVAADAGYWTTTNTDAVTAGSLWQNAAPVTATYAASVALNMASGANFAVTLTGNLTLANPTNAKPGQTGIIALAQDATGSRTISFGTTWKFAGGTAPTLTTTASAVDYLTYWCQTSSFCYASLVKDIK